MLAGHSQIPANHQFCSVQFGPVGDSSALAPRERTGDHFQGTDVVRGLSVAMNRVKVRRGVLAGPVVDPDCDPVELRDSRHTRS